ncbi:hypothetical protein KGO04_04355 [Patescibacteria group bacterium]|nr:hypothetical protein [Patescibacteria group bacterium]MDE1944588.1 hypothetical protein [Patescibacteria group bacterium]MDE1945283.1 hypothetical protein [Patescibacteria group bacterium]
MKKIEASDEVFVLDVGQYIGESTRREIIVGEVLGKKMRYLSKEYPDWSEEHCIFSVPAVRPAAA